MRTPNIVGKSITLNGKSFTVAGVLERSFMLNAEVMPSEGPMDKVDIFLPLPLGPDAAQRRGDENYNIVVRLKPGVSVQQAQADIDVIANGIRIKDKRDASYGMDVIGLQKQVVGDVRRALLVLLGSVALVLLIACANVANLLLARAAGREKEVAIRTALGAGWQRLARQLLTESILLGLLGGAAGLLVARVSLLVVRTMNPGNIPRLDEIGINGTVLAFTFGLSLATGILFGLAPAWRAIKLDPNSSLKAGGRSGQSDGGLYLKRHRLRGLLVVSELALSLVLLIGAGLLIRSFIRLQSVAPGFTADNVLSMQFVVSDPKYQDQKDHRQLLPRSRNPHRPLAGRRGTKVLFRLSRSRARWAGEESTWRDTIRLRDRSCRSINGTQARTISGPCRFPWSRAASSRIRTTSTRRKSPSSTRNSRSDSGRIMTPSENISGSIRKSPSRLSASSGVVKQYGLDTDGKIATYFPLQQDLGPRHVPGGPFRRTESGTCERHHQRNPRGRSYGCCLRHSNHAGPLV